MHKIPLAEVDGSHLRVNGVLRTKPSSCRHDHGFHQAEGRALRGIDVDMEAMPDVVPTLAIVAAFAEDEWVAPSVVTTPDGTPLATAERRLAAARCKSCLLLIVGGNPCGEPKGDPDGVTN